MADPVPPQAVYLEKNAKVIFCLDCLCLQRVSSLHLLWGHEMQGHMATDAQRHCGQKGHDFATLNLGESGGI